MSQKEHLRAIQWLIEANPDELTREDVRSTIEWLYRILDVLDSKSAHLLSYNALILAAQTFLASMFISESSLGHCLSVIVLLPLAIPLLGAVFALKVFRVEWPFLGKISSGLAKGCGSTGAKEELRGLSEVCERREAAHETCLRWSIASSIGFAVVLLATIVALGAYPSSSDG